MIIAIYGNDFRPICGTMVSVKTVRNNTPRLVANSSTIPVNALLPKGCRIRMSGPAPKVYTGFGTSLNFASSGKLS